MCGEVMIAKQWGYRASSFNDTILRRGKRITEVRKMRMGTWEDNAQRQRGEFVSRSGGRVSWS